MIEWQLLLPRLKMGDWSHTRGLTKLLFYHTRGLTKLLFYHTRGLTKLLFYHARGLTKLLFYHTRGLTKLSFYHTRGLTKLLFYHTRGLTKLLFYHTGKLLKGQQHLLSIKCHFCKVSELAKPERATTYIHNFISCEHNTNKLESSNLKKSPLIMAILSFFLKRWLMFCGFLYL
jgi:phage FluMu protein Com